MNIRWRPYVWKEVHPVAPGEIQQLEASWGVRLPEDYKELVSAHQGMTPDPGSFKVGRGSNAFNVLLTITRDEKSVSYSAQHVYDVIRPHVPAGIHPFGETPGGEQLCFDYREGAEQPRVVLVTVEMFIYPVANSFREFLAGLFEV